MQKVVLGWPGIRTACRPLGLTKGSVAAREALAPEILHSCQQLSKHPAECAHSPQCPSPCGQLAESRHTSQALQLVECARSLACEHLLLLQMTPRAAPQCWPALIQTGRAWLQYQPVHQCRVHRHSTFVPHSGSSLWAEPDRECIAGWLHMLEPRLQVGLQVQHGDCSSRCRTAEDSASAATMTI